MIILIKKLFNASTKAFPYRTFRAFLNRAKLIVVGVSYRKITKLLLLAKHDSAAGLLTQGRPEIMGVLLWPYQCAAWSTTERLNRLLNHCNVMDELGLFFPFSINEQVVLADLGNVYDGLHIVLDQPRWFMREGQLVINLFVDRFRACSVAFSLYKEGGELVAVIGCVQGRNKEGIIDLYRSLAKKMHGVRPRDLLLELLRILVKELGVTRILAVSDEYRQHRHSFFAKKNFEVNYNDIWEDRGGIRVDEHFYCLEITQKRRDLKTVKSKKRSMYRKRFLLLDEIESSMLKSLSDFKAEEAEEAL